jgi:hypothetical protein
MAQNIISEALDANGTPLSEAPAAGTKRKPRRKSAGITTRAKSRLNDADLQLMSRRLEEVALNMVAMNRLTADAIADPDRVEWFLVAFREITRSSTKAIDAALRKITNGPGLGNFADDLARE